MKILILEPYFTGSHAAWAKGYQRYSQYHIEILCLSGQFLKWRMHGGAVTLVRMFRSQNFSPDLLMASDMLDLTTFLALTRHWIAEFPVVIYFHENQLSYPWSPDDRDVIQKRDKHYGFINYSSALAADAVFFNSQFHGFVKDFSQYAHWLYRADILPVTSNQDFFGASVVAAVYCGCFPILPKRLAYPEIFSLEFYPDNFYNNFDDLVKKLANAVKKNFESIRQQNLSAIVKRYSWQNICPIYDENFKTILK